MGSVGGSWAEVFMETVNPRRVKPSNSLMQRYKVFGYCWEKVAELVLGGLVLGEAK